MSLTKDILNPVTFDLLLLDKKYYLLRRKRKNLRRSPVVLLDPVLVQLGTEESPLLTQPRVLYHIPLEDCTELSATNVHPPPRGTQVPQLGEEPYPTPSNVPAIGPA